MEQATQIMTLEKALELKGRKAFEFFSKKENVEPLIKFVKDEALTLVPNVETKKGRDAIGSAALKVSKSRKAITDAIDLTIVDLQAKVNTAKEITKQVTEELNEVRLTVLEPRNIWQAAEDKKEEDRISAIQDSINHIIELGQIIGTESKTELASILESIENIDISTGFQEFSGEAAAAKATATKSINGRIVAIAQEEIIEEQNKASAIEARINKLRMKPIDLLGKTSATIQSEIDKIRHFEVLEADFDSRVDEVLAAIDLVITQLEQMKKMAEITELTAQKEEIEEVTEEQEAVNQIETPTPVVKQVEAKRFSMPTRAKASLTPQQQSDFLEYLEATWDGYQAALIQFNNQKAA